MNKKLFHIIIRSLGHYFFYLLKGIIGISKALLHIDYASKKEIAERKKICKACPCNIKNRCELCGCFIRFKIKLKHEICDAYCWPPNYWNYPTIEQRKLLLEFLKEEND